MIQFILGIIGSIIAAYIYDMLKKGEAKSPPLVMIVQPTRAPYNSRSVGKKAVNALDYRAVNRERGARSFAMVFFFVANFVLLWFAVYLPIFFGQGLFGTNQQFNLGQVKGLNWFTSASIPFSTVTTIAVIFTALVFLPLLLLSDKILPTVQKWYDKYWPVTFQSWLLLRSGILLFLTLLLSGLITYIFTSLSCLWSMAAPFIFLLIAWAYGASNSSR